MKQRNEAIDILKGIGITLVLTAHSLEGFVSQFAYTFHMPLFFIVTGLFISEYSKSTDMSYGLWHWKTTKKDFRRLMIPAIFTIILILIVSSLSYLFPKSYLENPVQLIWNEHPEKPIGYIVMLGNLWFLFALFFAKQYFYWVKQICGEKVLPFICFAVGALIVVIGRYAVLPIGMSTGISVLPFIWVGYYLKHHGGVDNGIPRWFYLSVLIWAIYVFYGKLRVGTMTYSWGYIPDIIAACGGTLFFYIVSKQISERTRYLRTILSFLGVYSLLLICAPSIETYCFPMQEVLPQMPFRSIAVIIGKVTWCAVFVFACIRIPFLRKVFGINR